MLNLSNDLLTHTASLLEENNKDIIRAREKGTPETMIDRLRLTEERIKEISEAVKQVVALKDPIGEVTNMWKMKPNSLLENESTTWSYRYHL